MRISKRSPNKTDEVVAVGLSAANASTLSKALHVPEWVFSGSSLVVEDCRNCFVDKDLP